MLISKDEDIGDGNIGRETPDCSVTPVRGNNEFVTVSTTDFFYPVRIAYNLS